MAQVNVYANADGSMAAQIPDFAMDATAQQIATNTGMSVAVLKSIMRGNTASAAGLRKMEQQLQQQVSVTRSTGQEVANAQKKGNRISEAQLKSLQTAQSQFGNGFKSLISEQRNLSNVFGPMVQGVNTLLQSFTGNGFLGKLAGVVAEGTTALAGFSLGIADEFRAQAGALASEIGGGLYTNMLELKTSAGEAGLFLNDLTAAAKQSGVGIAQLGQNVDQGLVQFTNLSRQFRNQTNAFGNYGLSVAELNELMLQEIDIMTSFGRSVGDVQLSMESTNGSLNTLLFETTALANLTGRNRRDMIRAQMDREMDEVGRLRFANMTEEERADARKSGNMMTAILGDFGNSVAGIADTAAAMGVSVETAMGIQDPNMMQMDQLTDGAISSLMDAYLANDRTRMEEIMRDLQSTLSEPANQQQLAQFASLAGMESARSLLSVFPELQRTLDNFAADRSGMAGFAGLGIDLNNLTPDQEALIRDAEALGLVGEKLQEFVAQLTTKAANTNIGIGEFSFTPGDAASTAEVVQSLIGGTGTLLGLDEGTLQDGFSGPALTALAGILAVRAAATQEPNAGGGGNGLGVAGAGAAGLGLGMGAARLRNAAAGGRAIVSSVAGGALRLGGGALAAMGLPAIVITGALAAIGVAAYAAVSTGRQNTRREEFKGAQGAAIGQVFADIQAEYGDLIGLGPGQVRRNTVLNSAEQMMREAGLDPTTVDTQTAYDFLVQAFDKTLKDNATTIVDGRNLRQFEATMTAVNERLSTGTISGNDYLKIEETLKQLNQRMPAYQAILKDPESYSTEIVEEASRGIQDLRTLTEALNNADIENLTDTSWFDDIITPENVARINSNIADLNQLVEDVSGISDTAGLTNLEDIQSIAEHFGQALVDKDIDYSGVSDERRAILEGIERMFEGNQEGVLNTLDMNLANNAALSDFLLRLGELAPTAFREQTNDDMIRLLQTIADTGQITSTAQLEQLQNQKTALMRESADRVTQ